MVQSRYKYNKVTPAVADEIRDVVGQAMRDDADGLRSRFEEIVRAEG